MLPHKCMPHLDIASLLPHFRKDAEEGEIIQEILIKMWSDSHMENNTWASI